MCLLAPPTDAKIMEYWIASAEPDYDPVKTPVTVAQAQARRHAAAIATLAQCDCTQHRASPLLSSLPSTHACAPRHGACRTDASACTRVPAFAGNFLKMQARACTLAID